MANETTPAEFEKMQQQAIRRVQEMKQRAGGGEGRPGEAGRGDVKGDARQQGKIFPGAKQNHAASPTRIFDGSAQDAQTAPDGEKVRKGASPGGPDAHNILGSLFNLDNDMSMLLPLVLLLSKEGADEILIMALIYIMS